MSERSLVCQEMSQEDYLKLLENSPKLKQKLNEIGILQNEDGLVARVNYSDLLTVDEKKYLMDNYSVLKLKELGVFTKFAPDGIYGCMSDKICDNCYKGLLAHREKE